MNCDNCGNEIKDFAICSDCEIELRTKAEELPENIYVVEYSCETKDGGTGFGEGKIICDNLVDAERIFKLIQENPDLFDFAPIDEGQKRLVIYDGQTVYLD